MSGFKIKPWGEFAEEFLSEYEIKKGSQFEARLFLAYEDMCNLFRLNVTDKIESLESQLAAERERVIQRDSRIKELKNHRNEQRKAIMGLKNEKDQLLESTHCMKELESQLASEREKVGRLKEALGFYANEKHHDPFGEMAILGDEGKLARKTLKEIEG